jgi:uncharacterized protein YpmS
MQMKTKIIKMGSINENNEANVNQTIEQLNATITVEIVDIQCTSDRVYIFYVDYPKSTMNPWL